MGYSPHEARESFACFLKMRATTLSAKENNWRHCTPSGQKTNTGILKSESRNCVWTLFQANPRHLNCSVCSGKMFQLRPPLIYARTGQGKPVENRRKTPTEFVLYRLSRQLSRTSWLQIAVCQFAIPACRWRNLRTRSGGRV